MKAMKSLKLLRFLKLGRLLKLSKILGNLDRDTLDKIEDFMQSGGTRSFVVFAQLIIGLTYACHILACGYVLVGRYGYTTYNDGSLEETNNGGNWLAKENLGPWKARDTAGLTPADDHKVMTIYIGAFYFALTTMTSVGYGDILPYNNAERVYAIILEFIGAIIFAMVIAQITAVVATMDTNARHMAEQLDAVTSFVDMRRFPERLGRRIRRHFRHFYAQKSAIDEVKIFNEMNQTLRRTVSAFLVSDLMGADSFFSTMPPLLWPKLLPLLTPMRFEATESVAIQGEECSDFYTVLSGIMMGELVVPEEKMSKPRIRHIITGDCVNVLSALGVWTKCVETVTANDTVETYAISTAKFRSLFSAASDVAVFEEMQRIEAKKFKMKPIIGTPFGKPVKYSCFSSLKFTVIQAKGLFATSKLKAIRGKAQKKNRGVECSSWVISDLIDKTSGKPFNAIWRHQTQKSKIDDEGDALPAGKQQDDGADEPRWAETVRWEDISAPFRNTALRIRIYFSFKGQDRLLGMTIINVESLARDTIGNARGVVKGWYPLGLNEKLASTPSSPDGTKKRERALRSGDFSYRVDETKLDELGSCIELKLQAERADNEIKPKRRDSAWILAKDRVLKGTLGAADIAEVQMLQSKPGTKKLDNKIDLS